MRKILAGKERKRAERDALQLVSRCIEKRECVLNAFEKNLMYINDAFYETSRMSNFTISAKLHHAAMNLYEQNGDKNVTLRIAIFPTSVIFILLLIGGRLKSFLKLVQLFI